MNSQLAIIESDSVIASMTRASHALAEAVSVSQTKTIIDVARAAEIYAKRQHLSESAISQATSVKVEAMRKLGEILKATPKNQGAKGLSGGGTRGTKKEPRVEDAPTLEELGLSKKESAVAQQLASLSEEAFEQVREGSVTIAKALAAVKADKEKPAPVAKPALKAGKTEPEPASANDEMAEAVLTINEQATEIEQLRDRLAVESMDVSEEGKAEAAEIIAELRNQVRLLEIELDAVKGSRDRYQRDNADLIVQVRRLNSQIKKQEA